MKFNITEDIESALMNFYLFNALNVISCILLLISAYRHNLYSFLFAAFAFIGSKIEMTLSAKSVGSNLFN